MEVNLSEPVHPPLREHLVVARPAAAEMLAPGLPGYEVERLWRPAGAAGYRWANDGVWLRPGDDLVVYRWRPGNAEDIAAINAMFSVVYYPGATALWPDEREVIAALVPERGARVLEICCGTGRITRPLVREGNRVVGVDVVAACLAASPRAEGVSWVCADARSLPFVDRSFDLALCLENSLGVLPGEEARVVAEMARVCQPGGRVILGLRSVPGSEEALERYGSAEGYLELSRVCSLHRTARFLLGIAPVCGLKGLRRLGVSGPRPWGGVVGYWVLERA